MIEISNITKTYNLGKSNAFVALKNISLTICDNDYVVILGKSGAGKSTLMHIIGCIDNFESGSLVIDGVDISNAKDTQLAKIRNENIGIVLQDFALIPDYSIFENVEIPLIFAGIKTKERRKLCNDAIKAVDLEEFKDKLTNQLSGGQKQRVAIARAIVNNPKYILADEPTGALDSKTSADILAIFRKLNEEGRTVIIITHDDEIAKGCKNVIVISDGRVSK
ncbi:MAG: ABC transporter ATP-binding protein [Oscillospiraceae bacterium]